MEMFVFLFVGMLVDVCVVVKKCWLIVVVVVGNVFEFYDFMVYSFFVILIGKLFFFVYLLFG